MALQTRLDGRSADNASFTIKDKNGKTLAKIRLVGAAGSTLEISTAEGLHIEKPNGWASNR